MTTEKTIALTRRTFVGKVMTLLFILFIYFFKFAKVMWLVSTRDRLGLQLSLIIHTQINNIFFQFYLFILLYNIVLVLPYIDMNPLWVYMCSPSSTSFPPLSPSHPSRSSQCTSPEHPVSCIEPGLVIRFTCDNLHVSMPFSHIIPSSPSPTESKRLFYTSVSLAVSHTGLLLPSF